MRSEKWAGARLSPVLFFPLHQERACAAPPTSLTGQRWQDDAAQ